MPKRKTQPTPPAGFDFERPQCAAYVGETVSTLHAWATLKKNLPYVIAGGRAWYRRCDADAFLRGKIIKPRAA